VVPVKAARKRRNGNSESIAIIDCGHCQMIEAEMIDINPRFCRLRIDRSLFTFEPAEVRIRFAWTDVIAHIIWTNTGDNYVEVGLLMPGENADV